MTGAGAIEWVWVDHGAADAVQVGDVVSADAGGMPTYHVMSVADGRAWLRDDQHAADWILPLAAFQWKARAAG